MRVNESVEPTPIRTVAVLGAGTMGGGIAAVLAAGGFQVVITDPAPGAAERAMERIRKRASEGSVWIAATLEEAVSAADLVIEAAPESMAIKRPLFERSDAAAPAHAILASNTSQFSIAALAAATGRPGLVCGMHWFNPPERMTLIEGIRATATSDATMARLSAVAEACGKRLVVVADRPGFVVNRVMAAAMLEAMRMLDEGVAPVADIDTVIKLGLNHPMGPLELADYVGLDVMLAIAESLREVLGEHFAPPEGLRRRVAEGDLGRKSGRGYHDYPPRHG
jgi:3-hydroxybutyryl-CoA dehydrogenase